MARARGRELDQWATALGVTNDENAEKLLLQMLVAAVLAGDMCRHLAFVTRSAPDEGVHRAALLAQISFGQIEDEIRPIYRAFQRHARGRG